MKQPQMNKSQCKNIRNIKKYQGSMISLKNTNSILIQQYRILERVIKSQRIQNKIYKNV